MTARRPATGSQPRADRSRAALIAETVDYILTEGFTPPSVRKITERAGVTWGVVQYHFGDLDGVLMAVVDQGFAELNECLDELRPKAAATPIEQRTEVVVDTVWQAFSTPVSMAALEILIATRVGRSAAANRHLASMSVRLNDVGLQLSDTIDPKDATRIGSIIWTAIRGMVTVQMLWPEQLDSAGDRRTLVDLITSYVRSLER